MVQVCEETTGKDTHHAITTFRDHHVLIAGELTLAIVLGIVAWLGPRSLSGPHAVLANIMVGIAIVHIALNARQ